MWRLALHTVSYAGVWRGQTQLTLEQTLRKAKELGFDGVMVMAKRPHASPLDLNEKDRQQLGDLLEKLDLTVACIAGYPDFTSGIDRPMMPFTEVQVLYVTELARLAKDLGATLVRVFTGFERQGIPFEAHWDACVRGLREAGKRVSDLGVTLAVQNHHDIGAHPDSFLWLLEEVGEPNVKAAFDAWAPCVQGIRGEALRVIVHRLAPYIAYTTCADYVALPRLQHDPALVHYSTPSPPVYWAVPMGEGVIDYPTFFGALDEIGYRGWVAFEMCAPLKGGGSLENLDEVAAAFLRYIRQEQWRKGPTG
ncbi:MAG: sugar phosphate isomerase/epimerase [Armatimonadetes bacterium]|nr:sugar phosphate isomerase/epimerase [Armatimonadota bacterium]MDW8121746.1 sugar phosphate isomerase/epimerase family protein [Armatimonadota bacterium]